MAQARMGTAAKKIPLREDAEAERSQHEVQVAHGLRKAAARKPKLRKRRIAMKTVPIPTKMNDQKSLRTDADDDAVQVNVLVEVGAEKSGLLWTNSV